MLRARILTAIVLIPVIVLVVHLGGWAFLILLGLLFSLAEMEFCHLVAQDGFRPQIVFGLLAVWLFLLDAQYPDLGLLRPSLTAVVLGSLTWQIFHRQGSPVADWGLTVVGGLYLGLGASFLLLLRNLPEGEWWTMTAVPSIMLADTGAFAVGKMWGRRRMAPSLSPKKTWEGYLAGVVTGGLLTAGLAALWRLGAGPEAAIGARHGLWLGLLIAVLAPLGDLAVSMVKRQVGAKDSSHLFPGHGGALDRVDSVIWAAIIGYYYVLLCAHP